MPWRIPVLGVAMGPEDGEWTGLRLGTRRGDVLCRYHPCQGATRAVVLVGGVGGGFDSPARGLYDRLAHDLRASGIQALRVRFRDATSLPEAVHDVLAGMSWLWDERVTSLGLVGHSLGGAAVIRAAAVSQVARAVVTLATQSYGADGVGSLRQCAVLAIHGRRDTVLPPSCSEWVVGQAREPRRLLLLEHADHGLDQAAGQVEAAVLEWLREHV